MFKENSNNRVRFVTWASLAVFAAAATFLCGCPKPSGKSPEVSVLTDEKAQEVASDIMHRCLSIASSANPISCLTDRCVEDRQTGDRCSCDDDGCVVTHGDEQASVEVGDSGVTIRVTDGDAVKVFTGGA